MELEGIKVVSTVVDAMTERVKYDWRLGCWSERKVYIPAFV